MKKLLPVLLVAAALALAPGGGARPQTTGPGYVDKVRVVLTDSGLSLSRSTFLRGGEGRFTVFNLGTRRYRFRLGAVSTRLLKHGENAIMLVPLDVRGHFLVEQWGTGGRVATAYIKII